jgi:hypothetical protein
LVESPTLSSVSKRSSLARKISLRRVSNPLRLLTVKALVRNKPVQNFNYIKLNVNQKS